MTALAHVLDLTRRGFAVFPVEPNGKRPAPGVRWTEWATTDTQTLTAAFRDNNLNVGVACGRSGLVVIDEDRPDLLVKYARSIGQTVPHTLTVRTAHGRHYYFRAPAGVALSNSRGRLPKGIDVRGAGGYVVGPGSTHSSGTVYTIEDDAPVVELLGWLRGELSEAVERDSVDVDVSEWLAQQDEDMCSIMADAAARAVRELPGARHEGMVRGQTNLVHLGVAGHHGALPALRSLHDAFVDAVAGEPARDPEGEWSRALDGAVRQSGAWTSTMFQGPRCGHDPVERVAVTPSSAATVETRRFDDLYLARSKLDDLPRGEPLISGVIDRHALLVVAGRDDTFKSFLVLDWLCCLATGKDWLLGCQTPERQRVLYVVGEGAWGLGARIRAWEAAYSRKVDDAWLTVRRAPVNLFRQGEDLTDLLARIKAERYAVVVLDTLQRMSAGADLNLPRDATLVIESLDAIRQATPSGSVGYVAHTGKSDLDVRGASVLEDDADIVWRLKRDEGDSDVTAELAKRKDGPSGLLVKLRARSVQGAGSLVLEPAHGFSMLGTPPKQAFPALRELARRTAEDGLTLSALAQALGLQGKGSVSAAVDWLLTSGFVQKIASGRYPLYTASEAGRVRLAKLGEK